MATPTTPTTPNVRPVELWDLVSAFGRLMRETMALQPQDIVVDQTPLHVYMDTILKRLQQETRILFSSLFTPPYSRGRIVGLFLAVLELTKGRRIVPEQEEPFSDIWLSLAGRRSLQVRKQLPPRRRQRSRRRHRLVTNRMQKREAAGVQGNDAVARQLDRRPERQP